MAMPPWWTFNRIDNFGTIDPQGNYWKPDSNILTPPGYEVTALLPGTVTSVQRTGYGQSVVTVRLDNAVNSLATHTFYEHMHDATVQPGQHLTAGDLLGHANWTGEGAALGFGLYNGDVYGQGAAWNQLQADLAPGGKGYLNPTLLLDEAKSGKSILGGGGGTVIGGGGGLSSQGNPFLDGFKPLTDLIAQLGAFWSWLSSPVRLIKLVSGLLLIGAALFLFSAPEAAKSVAKHPELLLGAA